MQRNQNIRTKKETLVSLQPCRNNIKVNFYISLLIDVSIFLLQQQELSVLIILWGKLLGLIDVKSTITLSIVNVSVIIDS